MKHWRYAARLKSKSDFGGSRRWSNPGPVVSLEISRDEWREIHRWMQLSLGEDESKPSGHFLLEAWGHRRRWLATDQIQLTLLEVNAPPPLGDYDRSKPWTVLLNSRIFRGSDTSDAILEVSGHAGSRVLTVRCPAMSVSMPEPPGPFPQWRVPFAKLSGTEVRVEANALLNATNVLMAIPAGLEAERRPPTWLGVRGGQLIVEAQWNGSAPMRVELPLVRPSLDCGPIQVDSWRLGSLLVALDEQEVTITIPEKDTSPMGLRGGGYQAVLKPLERVGPLRERLENAMGEFLNSRKPSPDTDGDYSIESPEGHQLWVRLHADSDPVCVQVFSVLATDVEPSAGLMEELNAINTSAAYVKVLWVDGGVIAETDLVAENLGRTEIGNALTLVGETVEKYQSILGAFFGADDFADDR